MDLINKISNLDEFVKQKTLGNVFDRKTKNTRSFLFGIVVNNEDPLNTNRIKVRIPILDDSYYNDGDLDKGNNNLPWCLPLSRNFIGTPEQNSLVLVALMDISTPKFGRVYLDCLTDLNNEDILDIKRCVEEDKTYGNWNNIENALNIIIKSKPTNTKEYNTQNNVKYEVGIRGKGQNKIVLDKSAISLIQNKDRDESKIVVDTNILIDSSDEIEITSKKGGNKYHPLFDKPMYDFINEQNNVIKQIITVLNSVPSLTKKGSPNIPSPAAMQLIPKVAQLFINFQKLKIPGNGASKKITIN